MLWTLVAYYHWTHLIPYALVFAAAWVYRRWLAERLPRARNIVRTITLIAIVRLVLVDNPAICALYGLPIRPEDGASWFTDSIVAVRSTMLYAHYEATEFVAVGSSQTGAIFGPMPDDEVRLISYAGMQPAELPFLEEMIDDHDPRHLLVYVSMFDLGRPVETARLPDLPGDVTMLGDAWRLYRRFEPDEPLAFMRCATSWTLVEYQMHSIVKAARDGVVGANAAFHQFDALDALRAPDAAPAPSQWARHAASAEASQAMYFESHVASLRRFIEQHPERQVHIVEGHFHPDLYAPNVEMNARVEAALAEVAAAYPNAHFIPLEQQLALGPDDYVDGFHVSAEAGERLARHVIAGIRARHGQGAARR